ncbi:hypothetical protein SODALDRAFT_133095 [Sodiomyces alkalinus F11]|uniref:Transmembrane protein n=1 Tax=Sodiomyces alkalinus (strain CBS 110278 / VKM F-3762 / F11) TaxID=1314773 RepID=A0A3N2PYL3_SODAK|nr:hypothetical protein SODALDRAFT_133095 [Sodiomyces alkalinus F11]ROT39572.1 hypothetical protein SODALDRAFT_133095 [Sodiomyces alkalinus F11]
MKMSRFPSRGGRRRGLYTQIHRPRSPDHHRRMFTTQGVLRARVTFKNHPTLVHRLVLTPRLCDIARDLCLPCRIHSARPSSVGGENRRGADSCKRSRTGRCGWAGLFSFLFFVSFLFFSFLFFPRGPRVPPQAWSLRTSYELSSFVLHKDELN